MCRRPLIQGRGKKNRLIYQLPSLTTHEAADRLQQSQAEIISDDQEKVDLDDISGKIFIGGLSWQTTEANLRFYFEKYGELTDVALMMDKRTGKPR